MGAEPPHLRLPAPARLRERQARAGLDPVAPGRRVGLVRQGLRRRWFQLRVQLLRRRRQSKCAEAGGGEETEVYAAE